MSQVSFHCRPYSHPFDSAPRPAPGGVGGDGGGLKKQKIVLKSCGVGSSAVRQMYLTTRSDRRSLNTLKMEKLTASLFTKYLRLKLI